MTQASDCVSFIASTSSLTSSRRELFKGLSEKSSAQKPAPIIPPIPEKNKKIVMIHEKLAKKRPVNIYSFYFGSSPVDDVEQTSQKRHSLFSQTTSAFPE